MPDRHEFLRYPDHRVDEAPFDELVERIAAVLEEERPDVVITFGPDGITGHPDHIAIGKAATEAFHRVRRAEPRGGSAAAPAPGDPAVDARRVEPPAGRVGQGARWIRRSSISPAACPTTRWGSSIDCGPVVDRKLAALEEHRTQAGDMEDMEEEERRMALASESHVIAWPPHDARDPVLVDVFEGLGSP